MSKQQTSKQLERKVDGTGAGSDAGACLGDTAVTVADAEATLGRLEQERAGLLERHERHADERRKVSFDAFSGDSRASKLLDGLHEEAVRFQSRLASIDDALNEGRRRLERAKEHEARAADRQQAAELRETLIAFLETARRLDMALASVGEHGNKLHELQQQMHVLGAAVPSSEQLNRLGYRSLLTAIGGTVWRRHFETIGPLERRSFSQLCAAWARTIERGIRGRLGEPLDEEPNRNEQPAPAPEAA